MFKHTPGPWHTYGCTIRDADDAWIAHTDTTERLRAELTANARLIAAAPELVKALKAMLSLRAPATSEHDAVRQIARALLARIEGD